MRRELTLPKELWDQIPPEAQAAVWVLVATGDGELTLKWFGEPGLGGNGRVCQLSEVWLLKETGAANH